MVHGWLLAAILRALAKSNSEAVAAWVARAGLGVTALKVGSLELSSGAHRGGKAGRDADSGDKGDKNSGELHLGGIELVGYFFERDWYGSLDCNSELD